jgi:mycofactocin precursor
VAQKRENDKLLKLSYKYLFDLNEIERKFGKQMEKMTKDVWQEGEKKGFHSEDEEPLILEEIDIEEIFVDGICGVY